MSTDNTAYLTLIESGRRDRVLAFCITHPGVTHRQFEDAGRLSLSRLINLRSEAHRQAEEEEGKAAIRPFFISISAVKPPFKLREDGVYLGVVKILDRIIPVK